MYKFLTVAYSEMPAVESFFTDGERTYFDTLKIEKRRRDYALGRYALKKLIAENFVKTSLKNIEVLKSADGYPNLSINGAPSKIYVSISHSNGYGAACASETNKVGIDIELIEERSKAWAEMCFTKTEIALGSSAEYLTELWAKKEAVLKVLNVGLTAAMHQIEFDGNKINFYGKLAGTDGIKVETNKGLKNFITAISFKTGGIL
ncbi:MAG: 4'-phosphopantetheinyl transferase superfamily protein [Elusimicrobia bacterium]|nr:4'-phosphopantetheinyl transferase superfamily protein [Elusimicrobiota bacterium]